MKQKLLLKSMLLLFALIAGSSSVWADDYELYSGTITEGDYVIVYSGKAIKNTITSNRLDYTEPTITDNKISDPAATIVWHIAASGDYWTIYNAAVSKYAASTGSNNQAKLEASITDNSKWTVTGTSTYEFENLARASVDNRWLRNNGTYGFACYKNTTGGPLSLYKKSAAAPTKVSKPSISGAEAFLTSTEVTISCGTAGASIQYSTDNGTNWSAYTVPFTLNATATVKAKATKSGLTDSDIESKTFTKVTPITVADALTAIGNLSDNGTIADQCVAGIISQIDFYNSNDKAITYWISDDGTTTSQLEVFKGKGLNGADFAAITDLNVGDEVTVFGTVQKYVKNETTTPEFIAGSQLLKYEATGTPIPIINASNVTIDSEATSGEITYTIDNATTATLTAAEKEEYDWISNVTVTASKVTFTVTQNTGAQRIGYITLSYTDAADKDVKITQSATYGTATLPFAFDGGKADIANTDGLTHTGLGSDYSSSPKLKFDGAGDYVILKIAAGAEYLSYDIKGNPSGSDPWSGTFKVQTSADGITFTDARTYNSFDSFVLHQSLALSSSVRFVKWIFTEKGAGNVAVGKIGVNCEVAAVSDAGYITYNTPTAIDFEGTEGVTAYVVSAIGASSVTLEEITAAPAYTPVILRASEGILQLKLAAGAANVGTNLLQASRGANKAGEAPAYDYYALGKKDDVVGFFKVKDGVTIPAGKCFLIIAKSSAPEFLSFDGETTGINMVHGSEFKVNGEIYNLNGQRVAQPTKGLYIVNGKKVMFK